MFTYCTYLIMRIKKNRNDVGNAHPTQFRTNFLTCELTLQAPCRFKFTKLDGACFQNQEENIIHTSVNWKTKNAKQ